MLTVSPPSPAVGDAPHPDAVWIDLLDPSEEEARLVSDLTKLHVPTKAELSEIESSSRLRRSGDVLYLSIPLFMPGQPVKPVGFVLAREPFADRALRTASQLRGLRRRVSCARQHTRQQHGGVPRPDGRLGRPTGRRAGA